MPMSISLTEYVIFWFVIFGFLLPFFRGFVEMKCMRYRIDSFEVYGWCFWYSLKVVQPKLYCPLLECFSTLKGSAP